MAQSHSTEAMDDDSDDQLLEFRDDEELQQYMQKRLLELGFDEEVSNALRVHHTQMAELRGLYIAGLLCVSYMKNRDCVIGICLSVSLSICLFVCLSVNRVMQKIFS